VIGRVCFFAGSLIVRDAHFWKTKSPILMKFDTINFSEVKVKV